MSPGYTQLYKATISIGSSCLKNQSRNGWRSHSSENENDVEPTLPRMDLITIAIFMIIFGIQYSIQATKYHVHLNFFSLNLKNIYLSSSNGLGWYYCCWILWETVTLGIGDLLGEFYSYICPCFDVSNFT